MQNRIILTIFCIFQSINLFAFTLRDSTGVENNNGKTIIIHKVEAKETYYSIARKYGITPKAVIDYNSNISLQIGTVIKVPTERSFAAATGAALQKTLASSSPADNTKHPIIDYKVGPKETLLAIATRFNTTVDDIRELNNIKGSLLSIGQVLKVRQNTPAAPVAESPVKPVIINPAPAPPKSNTAVAAADSMSMDPEARLKYATNRYGLREQTERGVAVAIDDEHIDNTKMLALHRTAPVGTVIKVTNTMNGKSTFAKVVGKFTENETTKDVIIVVSRATANLIGALDKRFQVNIIYGVPNVN